MLIKHTHRNGHTEIIEFPIPHDVLEQIRNDRRLWPKPTVEPPDEEELAEMVSDSVCTETDGCNGIEPDGICEHGHVSWLMRLGFC